MFRSLTASRPFWLGVLCIVLLPSAVLAQTPSRDETFEAVTWNIEWFGHPTNGPSNRELQLTNAARLIRTLQPDLIAVQEISDLGYFNRLVDSLPRYAGFLAPYSQTQKTGFIYNTDIVEFVRAGFLFTTGDWASGRFPLGFEFDVYQGDEPKRVLAVNLHMKATTSSVRRNDYDRRLADAQQLHQHVSSELRDVKLIILGDWNDDVVRSTVDNLVTPFITFVNDPDYRFVSESLTRAGQASYLSRSMIDHILIARPLFAYHMDGTERVVRQTGITNYENTTSDHYPVEARFDFTRTLTSTPTFTAPEATSLSVFPSPARDRVMVSSTIEALHFRIVDALGRIVHEGIALGGPSEVSLAGWAPGVYAVQGVERGVPMTRTFVVQP